MSRLRDATSKGRSSPTTEPLLTSTKGGIGNTALAVMPSCGRASQLKPSPPELSEDSSPLEDEPLPVDPEVPSVPVVPSVPLLEPPVELVVSSVVISPPRVVDVLDSSLLVEPPAVGGPLDVEPSLLEEVPPLEPPPEVSSPGHPSVRRSEPHSQAFERTRGDLHACSAWRKRLAHEVSHFRMRCFSKSRAKQRDGVHSSA